MRDMKNARFNGKEHLNVLANLTSHSKLHKNHIYDFWNKSNQYLLCSMIVKRTDFKAVLLCLSPFLF